VANRSNKLCRRRRYSSLSSRPSEFAAASSLSCRAKVTEMGSVDENEGGSVGFGKRG
jgi:hypothetical protein